MERLARLARALHGPALALHGPAIAGAQLWIVVLHEGRLDDVTRQQGAIQLALRQDPDGLVGPP